MLRALVGNAVYAACQWLLIVMLAKKTGPAIVGEFALGLALTAPVVLFANLHLRALQATDTEHRYSPATYLRIRLATTSVAFAVVLGMAVFGERSRDESLAIVVVGLAKAIEAISDVLYGRLQQLERLDAVAISMVSRGVLSLTFGALFLATMSSATGVALGMALAWGIVLVGYDLPRSGIRLWRGEEGGKLLDLGLVKAALPLGVVALCVSLTPNIPRYFLDHYAGTEALGRYAALAYFVVAGATVANAVAQAASGRLASALRASSVEFPKLIGKLIAAALLFGAVTTLGAWRWGSTVLQLAYTPEYARDAHAFAWLMAAGAVSYAATFAWYGLMTLRAVSIQLPLFSAVAGVTAAACAVLVPRHGVEGAAIALFAGSTVQLVISLGIIQFRLSGISRRHPL